MADQCESQSLPRLSNNCEPLILPLYNLSDIYDDLTTVFVLTNNKEYAVRKGDDQQLAKHLSRIKVLNIRCKFGDVPIFQRLLSKGLPRLERLTIVVKSFDNATNTYAGGAATVDLCAQHLPRLVDLDVTNAIVATTRDVNSRLEALHLRFSGPRLGSRMPLEDFLQLLRDATRLESLTVDEYIDVPVSPVSRPPQVLNLTGADRRLKYLKLVDASNVLSTILSRLSISPQRLPVLHVEVVACDIGPPRDVILGMLPDNPASTLAILQNSIAVRVQHTSRSIFALDQLSPQERGLQLRMRHPFPPYQTLGQPEPGGEFFHEMVECLSIFGTAPDVYTLQLHGPMYEVQSSSWVTALDRFPCLRQLEIKDTSRGTHAGPDDSLSALLTALSSRSRAHKDVAVFHNMHFFQLSCTIDGPERMDDIIRCFAKRAQIGAPPPMDLQFELYTRRQWDRVEMGQFEHNLKRLASRVKVVFR